MKTKSLITFILFTFCLCSLAAKERPASQWFRGNTHTHSLKSDGDTTVPAAIEWYINQGYNFLLMADHNITSYPLPQLPSASKGGFILVPANEVTGTVHFTAFNIKEPLTYKEIMSPTGESNKETSKAEIIKKVSARITATGATAFVNHPNFSHGVQPEDIIGDNDITHIELFNGHPGCYNWGKEGHETMDNKWDKILSSGKWVWGVAADDTHSFKQFNRKKASPGRGWIMVNAESLTPESLQKAIDEGKFYASSGVYFDQCKMTNSSIEVKVSIKKTLKEIEKGFLFAHIDSTGTEGLLLEVIGKNGKILSSTTKESIRFAAKDTDGYFRVRATYTVKEGDVYMKYYGWSQPIKR